MTTYQLYKNLVAAALDQPAPTPALVAALNEVLTANDHPDRLKAEAPDVR